MNVKLGKKIRELRKAKNISQEVLTIVSWNQFSGSEQMDK